MSAVELRGKRVTIMGLGRFGGGLGAVRFCAERGANVLLTDLLTADDLTGSLAAIQDLLDAGLVQLRLGGHERRDFAEADLVIANPAVPRPWSNPFLKAAEQAGVLITTEIGLLCAALPNRERLLAVTGTAGKSTTTAMVGYVLQQAVDARQRVQVGGNIGGSLLGERIEPSDYVVLELSSAQLYWLRRAAEHGLHAHFSPRVAVVTTFAPNHLDWHEAESHYRDCKAYIHAHQTGEDTAILAEVGEAWEKLTGAARVLRPDFPALVPLVREVMRLPGTHNARNAVTAGCAARALLGEATMHTDAELAQTAAGFAGLPHRLELVHECAGVRAYDDSKSTTPASTRLAVEAFEEPHRLHLIVGGYDKQIDLTELIEAARRCKAAYPLGAVGPTLAAALGVDDCVRLEHAVQRACACALSGEVILLSPGCASWDQFKNYEERGTRFADLVRATLGK